MIDLTNKEAVEELVKSCVKNDQKSQQIFYKMFYGKMMTVCMRYSRNREEAQDILHDGFIKVFSKLKGFENKGSLEGWVRRLIVNNAIDHVRSRKDFYLQNGEDDFADHIADETNDMIETERLKQEKAEKVISLIQYLSPAYKTVFNMFVIENMSHQEIAEHLEISVGTSKSNLAKAKMKLKELFEQHFRNDE
ncbi:MAG: RNA polymerase subunit sigma-70 [Bacteroidetes bacterium HGW-Bacteroidetes-21]|nr:MAG: RNA polymerase subunit sigma-70 [Bacteroidetes bacterium HGW-Bacteroidetes-21]